ARGATGQRVRSTLAALDETEVLHGNDLGDREAVVQLSELDIARADTGHLIRLLGGAVGRRDQHGGCAIADQRTIVEVQRLGNRLAVHRLFEGNDLAQLRVRI